MIRVTLLALSLLWAPIALADKTPNPPPEPSQGGCATSPAQTSLASLALLGLLFGASRRRERPSC